MAEFKDMNKTIFPVKQIKGEFKIPSSKSFSQRVLACSLINKEKTTIINVGNSDDEQGLLQLISDAGAKIDRLDEKIIIQGIEFCGKSELNLNCRESGLAARMITPILANANFLIHLNGTGSLLKRPMHHYDRVMKILEVNFQSNEGMLPFQIQGPLKPKRIKIDGSLSSQFITGLILGYVSSPLLRNEIIEVRLIHRIETLHKVGLTKVHPAYITNLTSPPIWRSYVFLY